MFGPKSSDQDFFSAFSRHAAATARAAALLLELFEHPERDELAVQIERQEHEGDKILHDLVHALRATWITPFDRQDIQNLISRQDVLWAISAVPNLRNPDSRAFQGELGRALRDCVEARVIFAKRQIETRVKALPRIEPK